MGSLAVVAILVGLRSSNSLQQSDQGRIPNETDYLPGPAGYQPVESNTPVTPVTWGKPKPKPWAKPWAKPKPIFEAKREVVQKPKFVAWLISGQVSRFIYQDSTRYIDGGIHAWSGCSRIVNRECPISVDVHIALANTHVKQFRGPKYVLPAYEDGAFEEPAIKAHYSNLMGAKVQTNMKQKVALMKNAFFDSGAREVRVTILSEDQFNKTMQRVRTRILAKAAVSMDPPMTKASFERFWTKLPGHENRFEQNGNMMYMRHLAYSSAVEAEKNLPYTYTHVLYTREDNVFVHPSYTLLQLARDMDRGVSRLENETSEAPASVLVDKRCGWLAYSDKLYFASRRGIDVLFARTLDEHIAQMAVWINMARTSKVYRDPLMTEEYFKRLLEDAHANVTKFDFLRTEGRYRTGAEHLCIPDIYRKCTSVGDGFETCPP